MNIISLYVYNIYALFKIVYKSIINKVYYLNIAVFRGHSLAKVSLGVPSVYVDSIAKGYSHPFEMKVILYKGLSRERK